MIQCIIVDDEPKNISTLSKMLQLYCPDVIIAGSATNIETALALIQQLSPQLLFLDIQMPKGNAFDLLDQIMPVTFEIVFVTAFDNYAIKAFKYNALDYLLKPVDIEELKAAVHKVRTRVGMQHINTRLDNLLKQVRDNDNAKIALRTQQGMFFHTISDIVLCTAEGAYTRFEFLNGKSLLVTGTLKKYEETLPSRDFCRIHDACLVNLNHIVQYHVGKSGYVEMVNGRTAEVSQRRKTEFLNRFRS
ncbi:LytTR family DNA-binding domain-containing protein [Chitinophaga pendula]|uniref:LytR/AlgR family response regulator transcription factor n=1 Tax=Chitinophaga TaxID=79328 RepID=UPI000BB06305|nr:MULTISPECIES: LytTR family DNA-binding domain-containing protein [Chitinophaga]ASZ13128.1 DNA-binding response regulator [Chitinophaga sp. MD30]UCJ09246.1 LytTR family DNA-binding domain-containing protein [Chitinophaga pendula]